MMITPGGVAEVTAWLANLFGDEPSRSLWIALDEPVRLANVQCWIMNNGLDDPTVDAGDRDSLATELAETISTHRWFDVMLDWHIDQWRQVYADLRDGFGYVGEINAAGPDMEIVLLVPADRVGPFDANEALSAHCFVTRYTGSTWMIAALARRLPVPGWPPTEREAVPGFGRFTAEG